MLTEEKSLCMGCMSKLDENGKCRCGYDENEPTDSQCLAVRSTVGGKYLVGKMIRMDGEGITYIGLDKENEERVYVREFMPQKIAKRNELTGEVVASHGCETKYKMLMSDFSDLFNALHNFRHSENIIPVIDIVSDNGTVYAIYKCIQTISYGDYLTHNGGEFTWTQVKKLFMPLFTTLSYLHSNGFIHRGISPESIRVNAKGKLMLSYFGTSSLYMRGTPIEPTISEGYTAPEQYSVSDWQGEWTDVYSIAAVLYKSLTGTLPAGSDSRMENDRLCSPEELDSNIPSNVSDAIMNAMTLKVDYRTKSVDDFTAELLESTKSNTVLYDPKTAAENGIDIGIFAENEEPKEKPVKKKAVKKSENVKKFRIPWGLVVFMVALLILGGIVSFVFRYTELLGLGNKKNNDPTTSESTYTSEETKEENEYKVSVPNFVGRMRDTVEGNEQYSQFVLIFEEANNQSYNEGMIFEQSVNYRAQVDEGTEITLKVSTGPEKVPMPLCVGLTLEEASELLSEMGIAYQAMPNFSTEHEYNIVYEQTVPEGDEVALGNTLAKVTIFYGAQENGGSTHYYNEDDGGAIVIGRRN